jgi:hypothetical protein
MVPVQALEPVQRGSTFLSAGRLTPPAALDASVGGTEGSVLKPEAAEATSCDVEKAAIDKATLACPPLRGVAERNESWREEIKGKLLGEKAVNETSDIRQRNPFI